MYEYLSIYFDCTPWLTGIASEGAPRNDVGALGIGGAFSSFPMMTVIIILDLFVYNFRT